MTSRGPRKFVRQPRVGPGAAQNGPGGPRAPRKRPNRASREAQDGPRELQDGPRGCQDGSRSPSSRRTAQEVSTRASREPQDTTMGASQEAQDGLREHPPDTGGQGGEGWGGGRRSRHATRASCDTRGARAWRARRARQVRSGQDSVYSDASFLRPFSARHPNDFLEAQMVSWTPTKNDKRDREDSPTGPAERPRTAQESSRTAQRGCQGSSGWSLVAAELPKWSP